MIGGDNNGSTVPFLAVEIWETAVTNGVKKINRKLLKDW